MQLERELPLERVLGLLRRALERVRRRRGRELRLERVQGLRQRGLERVHRPWLRRGRAQVRGRVRAHRRHRLRRLRVRVWQRRVLGLGRLLERALVRHRLRRLRQQQPELVPGLLRGLLRGQGLRQAPRRELRLEWVLLRLREPVQVQGPPSQLVLPRQ